MINEPAQIDTVVEFRSPPDPSEPHLFIPRKHGNPAACEVCGGTQWDRIHDVPQRRDDDRQRR